MNPNNLSAFKTAPSLEVVDCLSAIPQVTVNDHQTAVNSNGDDD